MPITPVSYTARPYVSSPTLGQLINLRGQHAAEAELRRGELAAQMWANLGQQLASGIQSYAKERQEAPIRKQEAEARTIGLENARAEQRANAKATEDRSVLASAQGSGLEPEVVKSQLQQLGRADLVPIYEQTHANLETARLGLKEKQAAVKALENDYFGALAAGVKKAKLDPIAVDWALQQAEADGHDVTQIRQHIQQNPAALPQIIDTLIEQSPTQRKLLGEEGDRALRQTTEQRMAEQARQAAADREADNARQAATLSETQRHNRATEASAVANESAVPTLNEAGLDAAAKMYAQTGQLPAMGMGGKAANVRATIINRAAELYPDLNIAANKAEYGATSGTLTQLQKQRAAIGAFEQTAQKNIDLFLTQAGKVVDTGSPLANSLARTVSGRMLGSPDQAAYDAARQVAINEIAKITSNPTLAGQLSDTARKEVEAFNPQSATLKQTVAVMRLLKQDMGNRTKSLDDAIAQQRSTLRGQASSASGKILARDQDGNIHEAPVGTPLPAGWVAVP